MDPALLMSLSLCLHPRRVLLCTETSELGKIRPKLCPLLVLFVLGWAHGAVEAPPVGDPKRFPRAAARGGGWLR